MRSSWCGTDGTEQPLAQAGWCGAGGVGILWGLKEILLMPLTSEQVSDLLTAHCYRFIDNMDADDLFSYAMQMMMRSFDKDPGQGNTDFERLIQAIWVAEDEDDYSTQEFIADVVGDELAEEIIKITQF